MFARIAALAASLALAGCASSQSRSDWVWNEQITFHEDCKDWDDWDKPADPFRVHGDTYYVGTCGIGAILITNGKYPVLIDSGTQEGAKIVLRNIRRVGIDPAAIRMILTSHEHFDHVGGLPEILASGARGLTVESSVFDVYNTGRAQPDDPQYGMHEAMRPVRPQATVVGGSPMGITMDEGPPRLFHSISTPGHTPGALSWRWESCEGTDCRTIVYADSLSPVSSDDYRFSDHPEYLALYRAGLQRLRETECDILLTPHPSASGMLQKLAADDLSSGMTCTQYADSVEKRLDARLAKEAGSQ